MAQWLLTGNGIKAKVINGWSLGYTAMFSTFVLTTVIYFIFRQYRIWEYEARKKREYLVRDQEMTIKKLVDERVDQEKSLVLSRIAQQVAHDIRSPVAALDAFIGTLDEVQQDKKGILRKIVQRINDIASDLIRQSLEYKNKVQKSKSPPVSRIHKKRKGFQSQRCWRSCWKKKEFNIWVISWILSFRKKKRIVSVKSMSLSPRGRYQIV